MITLESQPLHRSEADTNGVWQRTINEIPPQDTLMIPCLGHSRVLQNIRQTGLTYGVDTDCAIINQWQNTKLDRTIKFVQADAVDFLSEFPWDKSKRYVVLIDPPHHYEWQGEKGYATFDHREFAQLITALKSVYPNISFILYHYNQDWYDNQLPGWRKVTFRLKHWEHTLYCSDSIEDGKLHDYSFVGDNWRERDELKKMFPRWRHQFIDMMPQERDMLFRLIFNHPFSTQGRSHQYHEGFLGKLSGMDARFREALLNHLRTDLESLLPEDLK